LGNLCAVEADIKLTLEQYDEATSQCSSLVHRAATGDLRVPSFDQVIEAVKEVYEKILPNKGGQNAQSVIFNLFWYTGESMNLLSYFPAHVTFGAELKSWHICIGHTMLSLALCVRRLPLTLASNPKVHQAARPSRP
jgi:hypothetical protein